MPSGKGVMPFVAPSLVWRLANEVIAHNYLCFEQDTGLVKLGDGVHRWNELPYIGEGFENVPDLLFSTEIAFSGSEDPWPDPITVPIDTTGASLLVAILTYYWNRFQETSFEDSKGNIWNWTKKYPNVGGSAVWIYYAENPIVGPGHTFHFIDGDSFSVQGYSGISRRLALDKYNGCTHSDPGNDVLTNPVMPANDNSLLVSALGYYEDSDLQGAFADSDFKTMDFQGANPPLYDNAGGQAWAYKTQEVKKQENVLWTLENFNGGYEDLAAMVAVFRAEGTVDEDVDKYLDAIEMTDTRICHAVEDLVYELKDATLWDYWTGDIDCIYPMLGASPERCAINLKDPRSLEEANRITWIGGWTFSDKGAKSDGITGIGNTHYIVAERGEPNKTHIAYYSRTEGMGGGDEYEMGNYDVSAALDLIVRYGPSGNFWANMYDPYVPITGASPTGQGLFILTRTAANSVALYRDGVQLANVTTPDNYFAGNLGPIVLNSASLTPSPSNVSARECGFASIGSGLDGQKSIEYSTIVANFMRRTNRQAVGWNPTNLTQAIAQYKSSKMTGYAEEQKVDLLEDFIGNNDATPVGPLTPTDPRPSYRKGERDPGGSLGAVPHLKFNSFYTKMDTPITTAFGDFAVFGIFSTEMPIFGYHPFVDKHSSLGWWLGSGPTNSSTIGGGILEATGASHFLPIPAGEWFSVFMQRQGSTKTLRVNGQISTTSCSTAPCNTTPMRIGAFAVGAGGGLFTMQELVVCNSFLSTVDLANMAMYVKKEYGLTF